MFSGTERGWIELGWGCESKVGRRGRKEGREGCGGLFRWGGWDDRRWYLPHLLEGNWAENLGFGGNVNGGCEVRGLRMGIGMVGMVLV